jgi:hypothetical protein
MVSYVFSQSAKGSGGQSGELEFNVIDITPAPFFTRLKRLDDRMFGRMEMLGGVFVLRGITTADVAASHA